MATIGQFYWPSVGTFVAAYGQFFMAANKPAATNDSKPLWRRADSSGCSRPPLTSPVRQRVRFGNVQSLLPG